MLSGRENDFFKLNMDMSFEVQRSIVDFQWVMGEPISAYKESCV